MEERGEEQTHFHVFPPKFPTSNRCLRFKSLSMYRKIMSPLIKMFQPLPSLSEGLDVPLED